MALPLLGAYAAPTRDGSSATTSSSCSAATSSAPLTSPTAAYGVISVRSGSPIQYLSMNAAGENFTLGGTTATFCPDSVGTACPPGTDTVFLGLGALDTEVPGGQLVYVAPDGHLGFTQAHSASYPTGAVLSPFTYTKNVGDTYGDLSTNAFGATGFMGCPTVDGSGLYQVFAAFAGAVVPNGDISTCLGFDALTVDYSLNPAPAAWQYI